MAIIDWLRASIAIGYTVGGDIDNSGLQRAATIIMQESLREGCALPQRFLITREIKDYLLAFLTLDNRADVIYL